MTSAKIDAIIHPVEDVVLAAAFYEAALGLKRIFVDGARFAAMDAGGLKLGFVGSSEDLTGGMAAACFRVPSVDDTVDVAKRAGGIVVAAPTKGPHEIRATMKDPWGNLFVLYGPIVIDRGLEDEAH